MFVHNTFLKKNKLLTAVVKTTRVFLGGGNTVRFPLERKPRSDYKLCC